MYVEGANYLYLIHDKYLLGHKENCHVCILLKSIGRSQIQLPLYFIRKLVALRLDLVQLVSAILFSQNILTKREKGNKKEKETGNKKREKNTCY